MRIKASAKSQMSTDLKNSKNIRNEFYRILCYFLVSRPRSSFYGMDAHFELSLLCCHAPMITFEWRLASGHPIVMPRYCIYVIIGMWTIAISELIKGSIVQICNAISLRKPWWHINDIKMHVMRIFNRAKRFDYNYENEILLFATLDKMIMIIRNDKKFIEISMHSVYAYTMSLWANTENNINKCW